MKVYSHYFLFEIILFIFVENRKQNLVQNFCFKIMLKDVTSLNGQGSIDYATILNTSNTASPTERSLYYRIDILKI